MILGIRQVGEIIRSSLNDLPSEDRNRELLRCMVSEPAKPKKGITPLLCLINIDTKKNKIQIENIELGKWNDNELVFDNEKLEEYLWLGNAGSNESQDRITTNGLKYLLSQTISALYESEYTTDKLKNEIKPVLNLYKDLGEDKKRYRYLLDITRFGFEVDWESIFYNDKREERKPKDWASELEKQFIKELDIHDKECVLYSLSINGNPLSKNPDYHLYLNKILIKKFFNEKQIGLCHLCGETKTFTISDFSKTQLKIFINQKVNFAYGISDKGFEKNYTLCKKCYESILLGERFIERNLQAYILSSKTYLIPELINPGAITETALMRVAEQVTKEIRGLARLDKVPDILQEFGDMQGYHQLNLLLLRPQQAGNKVVEIIPEVPPARLEHVARGVSKANARAVNLWGNRGEGWGWFNGFDDLLSILPVRKEKKGNKIVFITQPAIKAAKAIVLGQDFNHRLLVGDFMEVARAIFYENPSFYTKERDVHNYILRTMSFLIFLDELTLINWNDKVQLEESFMETIPEPYKKTLEELSFDTPRQALFLVGVLVGKIGSAQWKDSKSKPILNRINYQGMPYSRIKSFTVDVFESLRHNKLLDFSESIYSASKALLDKSEKQWTLSDKENVYYILSGYAFETQRIMFHKNEDNIKDIEVTQ